MHRTLRHLAVAAALASSVAFAQTNDMPATPPGAPTAATQPDALSKVSSSVKDAYSRIDQAKGVLSGHSPTRKDTAAQMLGQAEKDLGSAKSAIPTGGQQQGSSVLDTVTGKVASARKLLHGNHTTEARNALNEIPPLSSVQKDLQKELGGATGIGGAGQMGTPPEGTTPPSK